MAVLDRLPARLRAPFQQVRSVVETSLWLWPTAGAVAGVLVASVGLTLGSPQLPLLSALTDVEAARATLTTVITATTAAMSLLFTGTIVALQLATGQYSPRLLRDVLLDRRVRGSLALLVGTVAYALTVVPQLGGGAVPTIAVATGLAAGFGVLIAFIVFLDRIVDLLRLETILEDVTARALVAIDDTHPPDHDPISIELPPHAVTVEARRSGYVQAVTLEALGEAAATHGVNVMLRPSVGDFLVRDTAVAWIWRHQDDDGAEDDAPDDAPDRDTMDALAAAVDGALALGTDRTVTSDPAYGLRHLVDIGLRGVSPGVNDPTTAQQAINHATQLLVALAQRPLADRVMTRDGLVAVVRQPDLAGYLEVAQSQLLDYGGGDPRVVESLVHQLRDVLTGGTSRARIDLVRTHLDRIEADLRIRELPIHSRAMVTAGIDQVQALLEGTATEAEESAD